MRALAITGGGQQVCPVWLPPMKATSHFPWEPFANMSNVCIQQCKENGHLRFQKSPVSLSLLSSPKPTVLVCQWSLYFWGESPPDTATGRTNLPLCCDSEVLSACPRASADPKHPPQHPQPHFAPTHCPGCGAPLFLNPSPASWTQHKPGSLWMNSVPCGGAFLLTFVILQQG